MTSALSSSLPSPDAAAAAFGNATGVAGVGGVGGAVDGLDSAEIRGENFSALMESCPSYDDSDMEVVDLVRAFTKTFTREGLFFLFRSLPAVAPYVLPPRVKEEEEEEETLLGIRPTEVTFASRIFSLPTVVHFNDFSLISRSLLFLALKKAISQSN